MSLILLSLRQSAQSCRWGDSYTDGLGNAYIKDWVGWELINGFVILCSFAYSCVSWSLQLYHRTLQPNTNQQALPCQSLLMYRVCYGNNVRIFKCIVYKLTSCVLTLMSWELLLLTKPITWKPLWMDRIMDKNSTKQISPAAYYVCIREALKWTNWQLFSILSTLNRQFFLKLLYNYPCALKHYDQ